MAFFELADSDYDHYKPYLFEGPPGATEGDFRTLCERLVTVAAETVLAAHEESRGWVGWREITEEVACLLAGNGYRLVRPVCVVTNFGRGIIKAARDKSLQNGISDPAFERIVRYNEEVERQLHDRHKALSEKKD